MNFRKFVLLLLISVSTFAEGAKQNTLTKKQLHWFSEGAWLKGFSAKPDPSIDAVAFANHYQKFPARWDLVFKFISENDLKTLPLGKKVISDEVSINVQEYTTKEPGVERFEGHRANIDLQYVVSGKELIGIANRANAKEIVAFDDKKDYAGFQVPSITLHVATPAHFFVFFPANIHLPGIQYGEKAAVRKVVFKIKFD